MSKFIIILLLVLSSCASQAEREWSSWSREGVSQEDMEWRWCSAELDGEKFHRKGICYQAQECRTRKTIFGNVKKQCRNKLLFCYWGDIECMEYHNIFSMTINNSSRR